LPSAALLETKGPDAPTLCADATTGDLPRPMVLRERAARMRPQG